MKKKLQRKMKGIRSYISLAGKYLMLLCITQFTIHAVAQRVSPNGYEHWISDDFETFDSGLWSYGLEDDTPGSDKKLIWNSSTGGSGLLNDNYAGYITDEDSYIENGTLVLRNQQRIYQGTDPAAQFDYTSGWINSCGKVLINGTQRGVCLKLKARFPVGKDVWPAIWLVTDAPHWPPEIDIWEYFGQFFNATNKPELMALRYIYGHWSDPINEKHELLSFDSTYDIAQWHEYSWEWTAEAMIWKIDGATIGTMTNGVADSGSWPNKVIPSEAWPNEDFALVINNGVMSTLAGQGAVYPNYLTLDWLDIYQAIEVPITAINDPLESTDLMESYSSNSTIYTTEPTNFNGDVGRYCRTNTDLGYIIYDCSKIDDFSIEYWSWRWTGGGTMKVYGSVNGQTYQEIATSNMSPQIFGDRYLNTITPESSILADGFNYLKVELSGSDASWKDQIGSVSITKEETQDISVTGVSVMPTQNFLNVDSTLKLNAIFFPADASNQNVSWSSSNPAVLHVDTTGLVTGIKGGEAIISLITEDGGYIATSTIMVISSGAVKKPLNVVSTTTSNSASIIWDEGDNATWHTLSYRLAPDAWVQIDSVPNVDPDEYLLSGLQANSTYSFRMRSHSSTHSSAWTSTSFTTQEEVLKRAMLSVVEDKDTSKDVKIYPNPVSSILYIDGLVLAESFSIIGMDGTLVKKGFVSDQINISDLSSGVYLLKLANCTPVRIIKQ